MESEVIKKFNSELSSIHVSKVPSKTKILEITRAALKAKSLYKHVVFSIEKFILKCKPEHRLHVLYVIDSIIRASKHQFKHKDVYAARFLSHFDQILRILLNCKSSEKLKVVRTLNLWLANGVYQKEQIDHYREMFRKTGIDIDFESIEKAVKGEGADMRIYGGFYFKKSNTAINQKSTTPPFPPPQDGILGARPGETMGSSQNIGMTDVFKFQPSENIVDGTISQKEMLDLINRVGFDTTATFGKDPELLSKAHQLFVDSLKPRILLQNQQFENERKMKGNSIKKVLTTEFDYSDDEDEKDKEAEEEKEEPVKTMTHEEIFEMANGLIKNPNVVAALKTMADERIIAFNNASNLIRNQVAAGHHAGPPTTSAAPSLNSQSQSNIMNLAAAAAAAGQPNLATLQHLHSLNPQLLQNAQMNPAMQQALQSGRLAQLPPANSLNLAQLNALRGVGQAHQNNLLGFLGANPLLGIGGLGGAPPNDLVKQLSNMTQGGAQSHPFGVPPPALMHQHQQMPPGHGNNLVTSAQQQQLQFLENELEQSENDGKDDRKDRRTRERERSKERERRKQGLPSIKPGITYIASRTLWLKKVPQNCTESDLKIAVESCGETAGIRIIQSRACAFVTMESRKAAYDVINRLKEVTIAKKEFKVYWARLQGMTEERYVDMFDSERGVVGIPHDQLPANLEKFCEGAVLDIDSLPDDKKSMYKETGELILNSMNSRSMTMPGLPPGIPPQFSFNGLPIGNLPPPPGAYQPQQLKSGMMPPPPPQYASISGFQPLPPGVGPPLPSIQQGGGNPLAPPNFDPNKPPPPPSLMGHHFGGGGGPPTTPGNAVGAMMGANAYSARGGFRGGGGGAGGFRGGRGGGGFENGRGGYRNDQAAPSRAGRGEGGRFEERRDHGGDRGWQRDRERSTNDRRSGRYEEERRRYSRWNRDDESDGGRRERKSSSERGGERRRDRDGSPDHRRNRETRRTPPHPDNDYQLKRNDGNVGEKNGVDDETVSSTTLDDGKLPPPTGVETEALKNNEAVINAHQENVDEVPMDLE